MQKFTLVEPLSTGGYSTVYRCMDSIGIRYACKVLQKDTNKRIRVQKEIDLMKKMAFSTKVPRMVEALENDDAFFIVQEWCRGGAVRNYMSSYDQYSENTVASMVRGVLRALHHIHGAGIVHADIKPGNILLADTSEDAEVKVGDFGSAVELEFEVAETEEIVATPWYVSPEALSHTFAPASDVWSLGVTTYQLLSGRMPFNDRANPLHPSLAKVWYSILHEEPRFTSSAWEHISPDAKDFVRMCLQKSYKERPSVMDCLAHPWLTKTDCQDRFKGNVLQVTPFRFEEGPGMNAKTFKTRM
jgi:serine/threonine protein kinase